MRQLARQQRPPMLVLSVVLSLVLAVAGCGGDTEPSSTPEGTVPSSGFNKADAQRILATASAALEQFGDLPTAAIALLLAYDDGYSFEQIVDAVADGALSTDGDIAGVEPKLAVAGVARATKRALGASLGFASARKFDIDETAALLQAAQREFLESGDADLAIENYLVLVLWAVRDPYGIDMIDEGIVLGDFTAQTRAAMEQREREIRPDIYRDELDWCRTGEIWLN